MTEHPPTRPPRLRQTFAVVLATALVLMAPPAYAQSDAEARADFLRGREAYTHGRYQEAVDAWQRAYDASGRAELLFNLAQAYRGLGDATAELAALERYAASHPPGARGHDVGPRIYSLRERLAQTAIRVTGDLADASVRIDGDLCEPGADGTCRVSPGEHSLHAQRAGYQPFHATVQVAAAEQALVALVWRRRPSGVRHADLGSRLLLVGGATLAAVGVATGVTLYQRADGVPSGSARARRMRATAIASDAAMAAGAIAATAGLIRFLRSGRDDGAASTVDVAVVPRPRGVALQIQGAL